MVPHTIPTKARYTPDIALPAQGFDCNVAEQRNTYARCADGTQQLLGFGTFSVVKKRDDGLAV
ncbi:MAG: hypothetical protein ACKOW9_03585, partial [Candidatus Paceibacterota bacterium]